MKITSVDNYNINSNRTFRAKNINKAASKVNGKQVLDKFEKESNKIPPEFLVARNGCLISGGVLAFAAIFQMLHILPFMVLPTAGIIAGIGYALISLSLNTPPKNKTYSTGDKTKQKIKDECEIQKPEKKEIKDVKEVKSESPIVVKVPKTDRFAGMSSKEIIDTYDSKLIKDAIIAGKIDLTKISLRTFNFRLNNADYEEVINYFAESIKTEIDENRQTLLHKCDAKQVYTAMLNLWQYPEVVAERITAKDVNGEMPIHKYINDDYSEENFENIKQFHYALHSESQLNYQTLLTVFEAKNANGVSAQDWLKEHCRRERKQGHYYPFSETLLSLLHYAKKDYETETGKEYQPFIPVSDLKRKAYVTSLINMSSEMNYDNIMRILNDKEVQKTNGLDLNLDENYTAEIIEYLINNANAQEGVKIIAKLKELNRLDYDKVDKNGISAIELIMNAEDDMLLELVKNNTFKYRPELDYVYNHIQNPEFKEKIKKLKFDFVELKNAVETLSVEKLEKYISHSDSPLYNKDVHGLEMRVPSYKIMGNKFFKKYNEYFHRFVPYESY